MPEAKRVEVDIETMTEVLEIGVIEEDTETEILIVDLVIDQKVASIVGRKDILPRIVLNVSSKLLSAPKQRL